MAAGECPVCGSLVMAARAEIKELIAETRALADEQRQRNRLLQQAIKKKFVPPPPPGGGKRARGRPRLAVPPPLSAPPELPYLTIPEFCAMFKTSRASWPRHRPHLNVIYFGNRVMIKRAEVERYIDSLERPAQEAKR